MNFRSLTNFWRRGRRNKESGSSNANSFPSVPSQQQQLGQRGVTPFENCHSALHHIRRFLESRGSVASLTCPLPDGDPVHSRTPASAGMTGSSTSILRSLRATHSAKEPPLPLKQEREEMIAALELCLYEVPDEEVGRVVRAVGSSSNNNSTSSNNDNVANADVGEAVKVGVASPPLSSVDNSSAAATTIPTYTQQHWRVLLLQLVNALLEIDRTIYACIMERWQQQRSSVTSANSSPSSQDKVSVSRSALSPPGGGFDVSGSSSFQAVPPAAVASATKGTATTTPNDLCGCGNDVKLSGYQQAEEQLPLVKNLTTWIIMRSILQRQVEWQSTEGASSSEAEVVVVPTEETGPNASTRPLILSSRAEKTMCCAIPVPWGEVVAELMGATGVTQRQTAEAIISLWFLQEKSGHELVQCVLQKPRHEPGNAAVGKQNVAQDAVNRAVDDQAVPTQKKDAAKHIVDTVCIEELVEEIEMVYEQNVVMTWVAYLEQLLSSLATEKAGNGDVIRPSNVVCSCHMMSAYAVCSPYWSEEKRQQVFQILQKVWKENCDSFLSTCTLSLRSPSAAAAAAGWKSAGSTVDGSCGANYILSPEEGGVGNDGLDATVGSLFSDSHKQPRVPQPTSDRYAVADEGDSPSLQSSVNSLPEMSTTPTAAAAAEAVVVVTQDTSDDSLEEELVSFMLHVAWVEVLHVRVQQCLRGRTPRFVEAERCANEERDVALAMRWLMCRQSALESLVHAHIAAGKYAAALKMAQAHFAHAKNEWSVGKHELGSGVKYLRSMGLLAQAQQACHMDASLIETAQFALPQAALCEQMVQDLAPTGGTYVVRYAAARHEIYCAKLLYLRESWRAYHRLDDAVHTAMYFDLYMEHIKHGQRSLRDAGVYVALKERGEQLEEEKEYKNAVLVFKQAVECAKGLSVTLPVPLPVPPSSSSSSSAAAAVTTSTTNTTTTARNADGAAEARKSRAVDYELGMVCCEAESERNLALAYVTQAEHEVNVRERRQQLSNAVNSAYAAQNALQRCAPKGKASGGVAPIDVASSLVVVARALLQLGQPKKAALLLEPLIEDKVNSASLRPPLWSDVLLPLGRTLTSADVDERVELLQVKITTYDVHTQCLSKFDAERACRETKRAQEFLQEVKAWAMALLKEPPSGNGVGDNTTLEGGQTLAAVAPVMIMEKFSISQILRRVNAEQPILTITCGDALAMLGKWEDALQEYSNALAMYTGGDGLIGSNTDPTLTARERERARNDCKLGESLVLAKLAEVYAALEKPKTAVHYYHQVLEYASEVGNTLLQYNALIRLARLYTATCNHGEAGEQWAKVSELAKEYEDSEISRETTRNIVTAQRAAGMYLDVVNTAKELDALASTAEGVDAAADRRFALEALADAHLQLGQYKECIKTLDEREKVQDKCGQGKGTLLSMRARALLGDGAVVDAIKVLTLWAHKARQLFNWAEFGHANALLALAHATVGQTFKARRHHQIVLAAFSEVADMSRESCHAVMESARWLVHYYYLNDEEVTLVDDGIDKAGHQDNNKASSPSPAQPKATNSTTSVGGSGGRCGSRGALPDDGEAGVHQVRNDSGDLNVLMREEEKRMKNIRKSDDGTHSGKGQSIEEEGGTEDAGETLANCSMFGMNLASLVDDDNSSSTENKAAPKPQGEELPAAVERPRAASPPASSSHASAATATPTRGPMTSLANVSLCKRPAVLEGESDIVVQDPLPSVNVPEVLREEFPQREATKVSTLCFRRALETIEMATQLSLMPPTMRQQLIPRNPADVVDLALVSFPRCTFVFYFAEFSTQYSVVVRPAGRSFFLRRSVQVYSLKDYHTKKAPVPPHQPILSEAETPQPSHTGRRVSIIASSLSSIARRSHANSVEASQIVLDVNAEETAKNIELLQSLQDLYADLWMPVQISLRLAQCSNDEAECLVLVVDPTLLHVPFPALQDSAAGVESLGQQFTLAVTPTVAQFMHTMRRDTKPSLLQAPCESRYVFLPEDAVIGGGGSTTTMTMAGASPESQGMYRTEDVSSKTSLTTQKSTGTAATEERRHIALASASGASVLWLADTPHPWTLCTGCTRKEVISAFTSPSCRALMVLCDPVEHMFKVGDGMVRLADVTRGHPRLPESLDLVVVTNSRETAPTADEAGVAARLCLDHGCRRVLRLDLQPGAQVTESHHQLLRLFLERLAVAQRWGMRYPYALALRMAQDEARRCCLPPAVLASLTLIGAA